MLQFLGGNGAPVAGRFAPPDIRPRGRKLQCTLTDLGAQSVRLRVQRAHLSHRARQIRPRGRQRDPRIGAVELDQRLSGFDVLGIVDQHAADGAGDLARDRHDVRRDVGIIGGFVVATVQQLERGVGPEQDQHDDGERRQSAAAPAGGGLGGYGGLGCTHRGAPGSKLPPSTRRRFMRARRRLLCEVRSARRASRTRDSASSRTIWLLSPAA
ncbi:MAG: hypothetical protein CMLOHMNK_01192 [Steroidobacteraceae bacterium]|nr:hypothetical protein [Steroidobacteraceae bacterium]